LLTLTGSAGGSAAAGPHHTWVALRKRARVWHYDKNGMATWPVESANAQKPMPEVRLGSQQSQQKVEWLPVIESPVID